MKSLNYVHRLLKMLNPPFRHGEQYYSDGRVKTEN